MKQFNQLGYWFDERLNCQIYPDPFHQQTKPLSQFGTKLEELSDDPQDEVVYKQTEDGLNYIPGRKKPRSSDWDVFRYY